MIRTTFLVYLLLGASLLYGQSKPAFLTDYNKKWVDSVFNSLTLDEKIGQLLMPRGNYSGKPHDVETLKMWVRDYKIGGIVFFASNPVTQAKLTNELQQISKTPLFIGMDLEWGVGMRLDSTDRFPYAVSLGAIKGHDDLIEAMGREVGLQCKRLGVHINYAPVVDVNNNADNPVINFRSYGADKENVASKGLAYMKGMQRQNLFCTAKHFPGHGDTDVDSHHDLPVINHDKKRLYEIELYPFKKLIDQGLSGIMTAHLNIPSLEPVKGLASTFSKNIVTNVLRKDLNFQGLTFTDAMEMQGAVKNFPNGEAMVKALLAGNDILETFIDVPGTVEAIKTAIKNKTISVEIINNKVRKILMAKSWVGLDSFNFIKLENLVPDLNTIESDLLNFKLTEKSITCLKNEKNILPLINLNQKIAVLSVDSEGITDFYKMVRNYAEADFYHLPKNASEVMTDSVMQKLNNYDLVISAFHLIDIRASKNYGLTPSNTSIFNALAVKDNVIMCLLGNPYILTKVPALGKCKTFIIGYQQNKYTEMLIPQMIFGGLPTLGVFPVQISDDFSLGQNVKLKNINRLSYGIPELVGMDRSILTIGLDSIIKNGLNEKAFPGCVLQVAKEGKVIFHKAYGYHTYEDQQKANSTLRLNEPGGQYSFIDDAMDNPESLKTTLRPQSKNIDIKGKLMPDDVFDLASVTKVSASALAIMQLMNEDKLDLNEPLGKYCPSVLGTDKANLLMKDLLTHRAGLKAWIPFWRNAIDTVATMQKAVNMYPDFEKECLVTIKKPGFIKRLFGKKPVKTIHYLASLKANPELWMKMLNAETRTWKTGIFSSNLSSVFNIKVAENIYTHQSYRNFIFKQIADSPLDSIKRNVYSDLHYYYYPEIIKHLTGQSFENYLGITYASLGANSLTFNPLAKKNPVNIVPTEFDSIFRQQLLRGFVHDEGAAMIGGISGHAGLFGNSNDLTKIMQMYLQKGQYGSKSYFRPEIIDYCTAYQYPEEKNRRGIGFDKKDFDPTIINAPMLASDSSYGHSGFTGTYTWVDPKYNLVYVFLSNRVYPTRNNSKISTLNIRQAIGDFLIMNMPFK